MKGFNIGIQIAGRDINNIGNRLGITTIEFEDKGQDFLEWDLDDETGKVLDCRPFQARIWCKFYVDEPKHLKVGDRVQISETPIDPNNMLQEFRSINYPIVKITSK